MGEFLYAKFTLVCSGEVQCVLNGLSILNIMQNYACAADLGLPDMSRAASLLAPSGQNTLPYVSLPSPIIMESGYAHSLSGCLRELCQIAESVLARRGRYATFETLLEAGHSESNARMLAELHLPVAGSLKYGRADVLIGEHGAKVLELNPGSEIGGFWISRLHSAFNDVPSYRRLMGRELLEFVNPFDCFVTELRSHPEFRGSVCVVEEPGSTNAAYLVDMLRDAGLDAYHTCIDSLRLLSNGEVFAYGAPEMPLLVRYFFAEHAERAWSSGLLDLALLQSPQWFLDMSPCVFDSKGCLALLWGAMMHNELSDRESELVLSMVPPTFFANDLPADTLLSLPSEWVLKSCDGAGGDWVFRGDACTPVEWAAAVETARRGRWIAQKLVDGQLLYYGDNRWEPTFGVHYMPSTSHSGFTVRATQQHGVVGASSTRRSIVLLRSSATSAY